MNGNATGARQRQSGYAIAAVSFIGMIAMAGAATMLSNAPVAEVAGIEENLLQIRGHWAAIGMYSYAISRARHDGTCSPNCNQGDRTRVDGYQAYVEEIYNAKNKNLTTNNPTSMRWSYGELHPDYHVQLVSTVSDPDGGTDDGRLLFETGLDTFGFGDFLDPKRLTLHSAQTRAVVCTGLAAVGDACLNSIDNANTSGVSRLQDFRINRP